MRKLIAGVALVAAAAMGVSGCMESDAQDRENKTRQSGFDALQARQPGETMDYSPTRNGLRFFVEKWSEPGKLSYVYLLNMNGDVIGYYVLKGLPISYCAQLYPPAQVDRGSSGYAMIPQPAVDGAYYSGSGCQQYYGIDATTDSYVEWSIGGGISFLVHEQPIGRPETDRRALGPTSIGEER